MLLPLNFHKTFIPERRLIAALLEYASQGKAGNHAEIAAETGIPMGKSSGKVPAILDYSRGMGLVELEGPAGKFPKQLRLTDFGRVVYEHDRWLGQPLTQWLAHLHLCLPDTGATVWYKVFVEGRHVIGSSFRVEQLEDYLVAIFGPGRKRRGPLVQAYLDDAAMGRALVLRQDGDLIRREKAPLRDEFAFAYAAFFLKVLEDRFADEFQVTTSDFNDRTRCFDSCLWETSEIEQALTLMERTGNIGIDRQMRPWIVERRASAGEAWDRIYQADG